MNKTAQDSQKGFAPIVLIIGGIVVVLIIIGIASGGLTGSFKVTTNNQPTPKPPEEVTETTNSEVQPSPTSAPSTSSAFKTFTSDEKNLSFEYPESWNVQDTSDNVTVSLMEEGKTNNAAAAISAISKPLGSAKGFQFASIVDMQRVALKNEFNVSEFAVDKETKVGTKEARLLEFSGTISGNPLTGRYLTTADADNIYAITVMADTDKWSKYSADLQKALDSFKVLK